MKLLHFYTILSFVLISISTVSFGAQQNRSLKDLYNQLVQHQKGISPATYLTYDTMMASRAVHMTPAIFKPFLDNAAQTGLVQQYKQLLMGDDDYNMIYFFSPEKLILIAAMQNIFGGGNPFNYNPVRQLSQLSTVLNPLLGQYWSGNGSLINITHYSLLNSLIDNISDLEKNPATSNDLKLKNSSSQLRTALEGAVKKLPLFDANEFKGLSKKAEAAALKNPSAAEGLRATIIPALRNFVNQYGQ